MACIACGLGVNGDGKGRVDLDTNGGLECLGTSGGTTNVAGNGVKIKKDPNPANGLILSAAGAYVPRQSNFETYYSNVVGGAVSNPNVPIGAPFVSAETSITLSNTGVATKRYMAQPVIAYGTTNVTVGIWMEIEASVDGTWFTPGAISMTAGNVVSPVSAHIFPIILGVGETRVVKARMRLYTGNIGVYNVQLSVWGGYSD